MGFLQSMLASTVLSESSLFEQIFLSSPVATIVTDENGIVILSNEAFSNLSGYSKDEIEGERLSLLKSGQYDHGFYEKMWAKLSEEGSYEGEIWNRHKNRSLILVSEKIQRVHHQKKTYYIGMFEDITKEHHLMQRYQHLALHDPLTGLANRNLVKTRFSHALSSSIRSGKKLGMILCDLNEFKQINDQFNHQTGDKVLIEVAKHLNQNLRQSDTVSRYGGDEFLIIVENLETSDELALLIQKIGTRLMMNNMDEEEPLQISWSIGYSCFPQDGTTYDQLFQIADSKLYNQKSNYYGH